MQSRELVCAAARGPEQPTGDGDALERVAQRRDPIRGADPALGAGGLDRDAAGLLARGHAHRVTLAEESAREPLRTRPAADKQNPRHGGDYRGAAISHPGPLQR